MWLAHDNISYDDIKLVGHTACINTVLAYKLSIGMV